jgi:hypothetical protein
MMLVVGPVNSNEKEKKRSSSNNRNVIHRNETTNPTSRQVINLHQSLSINHQSSSIFINQSSIFINLHQSSSINHQSIINQSSINQSSIIIGGKQ